MYPASQNVNHSAFPLKPAPEMTYEEFLESNPAIGYLKIQASRAHGAIPMRGVRIFIIQYFKDLRVLFFDGETDEDGIINEIALPAPPRSNSMSPASSGMGAVYQVYASHDHFEPAHYQIGIFDDITAILPVTLYLVKEG